MQEPGPGLGPGPGPVLDLEPVPVSVPEPGLDRSTDNPSNRNSSCVVLEYCNGDIFSQSLKRCGQQRFNKRGNTGRLSQTGNRLELNEIDQRKRAHTATKIHQRFVLRKRQKDNRMPNSSITKKFDLIVLNSLFCSFKNGKKVMLETIWNPEKLKKKNNNQIHYYESIDWYPNDLPIPLYYESNTLPIGRLRWSAHKILSQIKTNRRAVLMQCNATYNKVQWNRINSR